MFDRYAHPTLDNTLPLRQAAVMTTKTTTTKTPADPLAPVREATEQIELHRAEMARWSLERAARTREALEAGMSQVAVARALGVTPAAIGNLLRRTAPAQVTE